MKATSTGIDSRLTRRQRLVAGAIAGVLLVLAVALPIEHGLGLIPTLIATEEIIEVEPHVIGPAPNSTAEAHPAR